MASREASASGPVPWRKGAAGARHSGVVCGARRGARGTEPAVGVARAPGAGAWHQTRGPRSGPRAKPPARRAWRSAPNALLFILVTDLTERDVAARVPSVADVELRVLALRDPITVRPGTSLADCIEVIRQTGSADSVFVTDVDGRLRGVLTERDIFARLVGTVVDLNRPVESIMKEHPWTLHLDQPVRHAIDLMQTGRYRNVPLVDDDDMLVGVVRPVDVLRYLAEAFPEELLNLPPRPHQVIPETEGA